MELENTKFNNVNNNIYIFMAKVFQRDNFFAHLFWYQCLIKSFPAEIKTKYLENKNCLTTKLIQILDLENYIKDITYENVCM